MGLQTLVAHRPSTSTTFDGTASTAGAGTRGKCAAGDAVPPMRSESSISLSSSTCEETKSARRDGDDDELEALAWSATRALARTGVNTRIVS